MHELAKAVDVLLCGALLVPCIDIWLKAQIKLICCTDSLDPTFGEENKVGGVHIISATLCTIEQPQLVFSGFCILTHCGPCPLKISFMVSPHYSITHSIF